MNAIQKASKSAKQASTINIDQLANNFAHSADVMSIIESLREKRAGIVTDVALSSSKVYNQALRNAQLRAGSQSDQIQRFILVSRGKIIARATYNHEKRVIKCDYIESKRSETLNFKANARINYQLTVIHMLKALNLVARDETSTRSSSASRAQFDSLVDQLAKARGVSVDVIKRELDKQASKNAKASTRKNSAASKKASKPRGTLAKAESKRAKAESVKAESEARAISEARDVLEKQA